MPTFFGRVLLAALVVNSIKLVVYQSSGLTIFNSDKGRAPEGISCFSKIPPILSHRPSEATRSHPAKWGIYESAKRFSTDSNTSSPSERMKKNRKQAKLTGAAFNQRS